MNHGYVVAAVLVHAYTDMSIPAQTQAFELLPVTVSFAAPMSTACASVDRILNLLDISER